MVSLYLQRRTLRMLISHVSILDAWIVLFFGYIWISFLFSSLHWPCATKTWRWPISGFEFPDVACIKSENKILQLPSGQYNMQAEITKTKYRALFVQKQYLCLFSSEPYFQNLEENVAHNISLICIYRMNGHYLYLTLFH